MMQGKRMALGGELAMIQAFMSMDTPQRPERRTTVKHRGLTGKQWETRKKRISAVKASKKANRR
jgi:hypothetical protein